MTAYAFCDQCEKYKLCSTVIQSGKIYCHDCKPVDKKNNESNDIHKEALRQAIFECDAKSNDSDVSRSFCDDCKYVHGWDMPSLWKASLECEECKDLNIKPEHQTIAYCFSCEEKKFFRKSEDCNDWFCVKCKLSQKEAYQIHSENNEEFKEKQEKLKKMLDDFNHKRTESFQIQTLFCGHCLATNGWDLHGLCKSSLTCEQCKKLNVKLDERKKSENNTFVDTDYESVKKTIKNRAINHPSYYQSSKMEVIDIIEAFQLNFLTGNVIKYLLRAGKKGDALEDFKKAQWYLQRAIDSYEKDCE